MQGHNKEDKNDSFQDAVKYVYLHVVPALFLILHLEKLLWKIEYLIVPEWCTGVEKRQYLLYLGKSKYKSPIEFCLTNDINIHAQDDICIEDVQFSRLNILIN